MSNVNKNYAELVNQVRADKKYTPYDSASNGAFDNTGTPLVSTNVQDALVELSGSSSTFNVTLLNNTPAFSVFTLDPANKAVVVNSSTVNLDPNTIVGITTQIGLAGAIVTAQKDNSILTNALWAFTPNQTVYLDSSGNLTQTAPISGTILPLGYAITATTVWFNVNGTFRPSVIVATAGAGLTAGMFINLYDNGGILTVRPADATTVPPQEAMGYVLDTVLIGNIVTIYYNGLNTALAGLTNGIPYYLTTNGALSSTAPAKPPYLAGNISQRIGVATGTSILLVNIQQPYVL